jgi:N-acyl-D-amino-acid deacylase
MLLWARHLHGGTKVEIAAARKAVLAAQKPDGGWAQLDNMHSDAYATGQTLWVLLQTSSPFAAHQPARASVRFAKKPLEPGAGARRLMRNERRQKAIRKGIEFLLKSQQADGSWFVKTRSKPVQVFFDNGDPHGKSQFISIPATGWATAAVAEWLSRQ